MIFADVDLLLSYKFLRPVLRLCTKDNLGYEESFRLNRKEFRVMRWLRRQIWGKRNLEDDAYKQVIMIILKLTNPWDFTIWACYFSLQKRLKESYELGVIEEDDTTKEQMYKLLDLVQSLKIAFDNTRYVCLNGISTTNWPCVVYSLSIEVALSQCCTF